jgi:hypothetical protein
VDKRGLIEKSTIVAGLGVEPSLRDYEPHVHRTLSRAMLLIQQGAYYTLSPLL